MTDEHPPDPVDDELDQLTGEALRLEAIDPSTGERLEGVV